MPKNTYRIQAIIDDFSRELDALEKKWPMTGSYARIDPYVSPYIQGGKYFELIIYHQESMIWYNDAGYDPISYQLLKSDILKFDDIAFDLGCNAGTMSLVMASKCSGGMVHSFDPYPWNPLATKFNARLNGLENIRVYPVGISNRDATIRVSPTDSRIYHEDVSEESQILTVSSFSRYKHLRPTFLKIDIEGAEHDLFSDNRPDDFSTVQQFVLEFHPIWLRPRNIDPVESLRAIERSGFALRHHYPENQVFETSTYNDSMVVFWGTRR